MEDIMAVYNRIKKSMEADILSGKAVMTHDNKNMVGYRVQFSNSGVSEDGNTKLLMKLFKKIDNVECVYETIKYCTHEQDHYVIMCQFPITDQQIPPTPKPGCGFF